MRSEGGGNGRIIPCWSQPPAQPTLKHSQCFLGQASKRRLWACQTLSCHWHVSCCWQQRLCCAACRDSHFISCGAHRPTLKKHPCSGRAPITSQIHRHRGNTDIKPLTNTLPRWTDSLSRVWLMRNLLRLHLIWASLQRSVMVLFYMGSDKHSSTLMQPEDPVRQDMQFYYVVSKNKLKMFLDYVKH